MHKKTQKKILAWPASLPYYQWFNHLAVIYKHFGEAAGYCLDPAIIQLLNKSEFLRGNLNK